MELQSGENIKKLVQALRDDDATAFDKLFAIYGPRLFGFVYGYLKITQEAEEIVQEVFLCVWRARKNLNPALSFKAYLFKIAYHQILEHFEHTTKQQAYKHNIIEEAVESTNDLDERLDYRMLLDKVELIISKLSSRQKEILIKKKKDGLSVKEIARQMKISPKTVENQLSSALKKIKKELGAENISAILFLLFTPESI